MEQRFETIPAKKFIGLKIMSSVVKEPESARIWPQFMPRRKEISSIKGNEVYALTVYPGDYFQKSFDPNAPFEKWATVEVNDFNSVPMGMETLESSGGLYAVFSYKGSVTEAYKALQYIYMSWLPSSDYLADGRPHMAVMGEKYKNNDPESEEEFWIPVKKKTT
ncbi:MAG: GyrI-like domain-containing protein [Bacteroidia bacterium]|nr:GyrI-like domain-containing protein [Bacteroidia bacterium]